jgi:cell division protein FtsA
VIVEIGSSWGLDENAVQVLGVGSESTEGVKNRIVTNIEAATESIRGALHEAEQMAGLEVQGVYVGLAGSHVEVSRSTGVVAVGGDEVTSEDVERLHEVASAVVIPPDRELLHAVPQDYAVDGRNGIQDPCGMAATRLESEVFIVTAGAVPCRNLRKAVDRAGFRVEELMLSPLASGLAVLDDTDRDAGVALIEIGGSSTEIVVFQDQRLCLIASLPWGSDTVSGDIVKGLGVPLSEAERLKRKYGVARTLNVDPNEHLALKGPTPGNTRQVSRELLAHIIEQRMDEIFGLVYDEFEERGLLGELAAGVVLTGGGAALEGTVELAQDVFNMPTSLGVPGRSLTGLVEAVQKPDYTTAVGLALYGCERDRDRGGGLTGRALARVTDWLKDFF